MKKLLLILCIISVTLISTFAQSKKADKEAIALVQFEKALTAIESKDFVITPKSWIGESEPTYITRFLSYEKEYVTLQEIIPGERLANKLKVSEYNQTTDKKGNVKISMNVFGFYLNGKITISLKKANGNLAYVIISPYPKKTQYYRIWGELLPRSESNYRRLPGEM